MMPLFNTNSFCDQNIATENTLELRNHLGKAFCWWKQENHKMQYQLLDCFHTRGIYVVLKKNWADCGEGGESSKVSLQPTRLLFQLKDQEHTTMCYSFYLLFTAPPAGWHPPSWQDVLWFLTSWVCPSWDISSWYVISSFSSQPAGSIPAGNSHPTGKIHCSN